MLIYPLIAALFGWLFASLLLQRIFRPLTPKQLLGIRWQGLLPAAYPQLQKTLSTRLSNVFSLESFAGKITDPANVKKIMPDAEAHIDEFLRVRLVKAMPVVGMFVGEKTIGSLKTLFIAELEELFPQIMNKYLQNLAQGNEVENMISEKLNEWSFEKMEAVLRPALKKPFLQVKCAAALLSLLVSLPQTLLVLPS